MSATTTSTGKPLLSLVVLSWNNLELTRRCVESLRRHTDLAAELIIVDNDSTDGSAEYATSAADVAVRNDTNLGFAAGMNSGLARASGVYVAFINNDTIFPPRWASRLIETLESGANPGIVMPAVTAAGNPVTVRESPGSERIVLTPFGEFPSGVWAHSLDIVDEGVLMKHESQATVRNLADARACTGTTWSSFCAAGRRSR